MYVFYNNTYMYVYFTVCISQCSIKKTFSWLLNSSIVVWFGEQSLLRSVEPTNQSTPAFFGAASLFSDFIGNTKYGEANSPLPTVFMGTLKKFWGENVPMTEVQMLTVKPDSVDGSGLPGNSRVWKLNLSSTPGRMSMLGTLKPSLMSASSWLLAIWYTDAGCSGWYLKHQTLTH